MTPGGRSVEWGYAQARFADVVAVGVDWATLLRRVYDVDALACPCGGKLRFAELIDNERAARALLATRGSAFGSGAVLDADPTRRAALRPDAALGLDDIRDYEVAEPTPDYEVARPPPDYEVAGPAPDYDAVDAVPNYDAIGPPLDSS